MSASVLRIQGACVNEVFEAVSSACKFDLDRQKNWSIACIQVCACKYCSFLRSLSVCVRQFAQSTRLRSRSAPELQGETTISDRDKTQSLIISAHSCGVLALNARRRACPTPPTERSETLKAQRYQQG